MSSRESARGRIRCGELGEDRLIAQLLEGLPALPEVVAGPGDDCAVLAGPGQDEYLLLKTDCVVEGVHFLPNEKPVRVGWKAMMRPLSDFAAMAGQPRYALVTLVVPANREVRWVTNLYRGLKKAASRFAVAIVGGETSGTRGPVVISVNVAGAVEKDLCLFRDGGKAGDILFVTGELGGSGKGRHLDFVPRIEEARWLSRHFRIHAMMDLSDGLGSDLPRLTIASGVDFQLDLERLPRARGCSIEKAISAGEDYELLFAIAPADASALEKRWRAKFPRLRLTRIGGFKRRRKNGSPELPHGFVHFQ
jgi:thiamine-monophosphate kinase